VVGGNGKERRGAEGLVGKGRGGRNWLGKEGVGGIGEEMKGCEKLVRKERGGRKSKERWRVEGNDKGGRDRNDKDK
jgi:hypothetical protein